MVDGWRHNPVGVYLMSCYAYEVLDNNFIPDHEFDKCGRFIEEWWDVIDHPHKKYIDPEGCAHTSAITVPYAELPLIVLNATHQLLKTDFRTSPVYKEAMQNLALRELL